MGKLVRDRIPDIILQNDGKKPRIRVLSPLAYKRELYTKLQEEVQELCEAKKQSALAEEAADVLEVLESILLHHNIARVAVTKLQQKKRKERGGFSKRIYLV